MWLQKTANVLESVTFPVTRFFNVIGTFFLAVMMLVTAVDVLSRFLFNMPVLGSIEVTGFLLAATIMLGIPYAAARKQHITIDIITSRLTGKKQLVTHGITTLVAIVLFAVVAWQSIRYAALMDKMNMVTAILQVPLRPFVFIVAFGFILTCIVLLGDLLQDMNKGISNAKQAAAWVAAGLIIIVLMYFAATGLRDMPWNVSIVTAGVIGLAVLFIAFLAGLPVFASLIFVGFLGMCYLRGTTAGMSIMGSSPFGTVSSYTFSVIPLFVLMGEFCFFAGIGRDLYDMAYRWMGSLSGGLSMGTIVACGGFAAVCGDSMATAVTMGTVAIPEMKRYKYNLKLAIGCVAAGGTLGVLIPPSLAFILYALLADQSIALLFIAGIVPGILLILIFMLSIYIRAVRNPALGPPGPSTTMKEKLVSLKGVWATLILFAIVIGGMYVGVFTPTEGGGMGAFGALVIGVARRRLTWKGIISSLLETGKISAVCIGILLGASIFGYFLAASKLPIVMAELVTQMAVPSTIILITILIIYLLLGCLMPAIPMLVLTVPIFYPVVMALGYDPIWFGVIMVLMFEMAVITPPMGINVLAMRTVTQDISLTDMFRGVIPFLFAMIVCVAIIIIFPDIALFLPNLFGN